MSSPRSQSPSTLDPHLSQYTPTQHKRKSTSTASPERDTSDTATTPRKKKSSKRERHHHGSLDNHNQHNGGVTSSSQSTAPPVQKLPTIKISLRLPANPAIIPSSSASSSHKSSSSSRNGGSKKKRRSPEQLTVVSENDEDERNHQEENGDEEVYPHQQYHSSGEEQDVRTSSHKKKKKHKHKHKHRHRAHEEYGEEADESIEAGTGTPKITLRLGKERKDNSSSLHGIHPDHFADMAILPELGDKQKTTSGGKGHSRSRSRSMSQASSSSPVVIKQEDAFQQSAYNDYNAPHVQHGQKRPFSSLRSERSVSEETELAEPGMTAMGNEDYDDPLAGDLDDPDDDMGDDGDDEEDEGLEQQNEGSDHSDDDDLKSPTTDSGMRAHLGSKSVKGGQKGSKTLPGLESVSKSSRIKKPKSSKDDNSREGSEQAMAKGGRKGKGHQRRVSTTRITTPAVPKKKELSVVCNKLLDSFIKKDMYVLFTDPVDPVMVPDYSTVIKNPMDFSTMRAKVERNFYPNIDEFYNDFKLVCDNARIYNSKETLYWRQADKLWEWGSKAIERERKSVLDKDEELLRSIKDEETVDVGGMGDYSNNLATTSGGRGPLLSIDGNVDSPTSMGDYRSHTPQQYRRTKKIKHRRDGTVAFTYSTDGSIEPASHPDPWSLVPVVQDFGSAPLVCPLVESNPHYNGQYLDDYPYWRAPTCAFRPAVFQDYGPYAILGRPTSDVGGASGVQNIPAYTGMVFGDEKGEAYVRSLAMFLDGIVDEKELATMSKDDAVGLLEVQEHVREKIETLTRGASTIVDKVATVIREEKLGIPSDVDTRVPMKLWRQDFTEEYEEAIELARMEDASTDLLESSDAKANLLEHMKGADDVEMPDHDRQQGTDDELVKGDGMEDSDISIQEEGMQGTSDGQVDSADKATKAKQATFEWVDIRQILRDIRAWPKILREKTDFESWRQLKVELDSLLPPSQRTTMATAPTRTDDEIEIKWGQKWTGGDSEKDKNWVCDYLDRNSGEMQQILQLLASKSIRDRNPGASTTASAVASPTASASTTGSPATVSTPTAGTPTSAVAGSDAHVTEQLIRSIRHRLAEMAQYVPLSEVNPQRLPPPIVPPTSSSKASAESSKTTSSRTASAPSESVAESSAPGSPDDGSISSLSSPGSSSP